jgi:hypothetical protein
VLAESFARQGRNPDSAKSIAPCWKTRRHWPFLRDRRVDAYAPITQRFIDPVTAPGGHKGRN